MLAVSLAPGRGGGQGVKDEVVEQCWYVCRSGVRETQHGHENATVQMGTPDLTSRPAT